MSLPSARFIVVTGTDTSVGKTIVTAALAVALRAAGRTVSVVKPVQTGVVDGEPGDVHVVAALSGVGAVHERGRLCLPLAPSTAALAERRQLPSVEDHATFVRSLATDVVLIEGAGGLLVQLDLDGGTLRDLATCLRADVVVVARESLGTLNHVALTLEALQAAGLRADVVIGSLSDDPGLAETSNRADLPRVLGRPLLGALPAGAGDLPPGAFQALAPSWFAGQPEAQPSEAPTASPTR